MPNRLALVLSFLLFAPLHAFAAGAPTILPGSPLSVLTGGGSSAPAPAPAPAPAARQGAPPVVSATAAGGRPAPAKHPPAATFEADDLGVAVVLHAAEKAGARLGGVWAAIERAVDPRPVAAWFAAVLSNPLTRASGLMATGTLALMAATALAVEIVLRLLVRPPRRALARRAAPWRAVQEEAAPTAPAAPAESVGAEAPPPPASPPLPSPPSSPPAPPSEPEAEEDGIASAEAGETEQMPQFRLALRAWLRRLPFAVLAFLLALLPVLGFISTVTGWLASGFVVAPATRASAIEFANAYVFCRVALEGAALILAPRTPALRLARLQDRYAARTFAWLRLLFATALFGTAAVKVFTGLGMSGAGTHVLLRVVVLAVHIELGGLIWRSRRPVARWIRGSGADTGLWGTLRRRFASLWWIVALFYVLALWVAWVAGVPNAFSFLLRLVGVFIGVVAAARIAIFLGYRALDRLLEGDATAAAHLPPALSARARAYHPLLRAVFRIIIGFIALAILLQGWGLGVLPFLLVDRLGRSLLSALVNIGITLAIAVVIWELATGWLNAEIDKLVRLGRMGRASRLRTLLPMLKATIAVVIVLVAGLVVLNQIGLNIAPLLAGAGVVGLAIGFGSQKLVQDIITGLFLLLEDTMQVGDVVSVGGLTGTVEKLSIRTIRLRAGDGSMNIIPFSSVTTVTNMTREFGMAQIAIQVSYGMDVETVIGVMKAAAAEMRAEQPWSSMMRDDLQVFGLDAFEGSAISITGQIRTGPGQHWSVKREYNRRMLKRFMEEGIAIPAAGGPPAAQHIVFDPDQLAALRQALTATPQSAAPPLLPAPAPDMKPS